MKEGEVMGRGIKNPKLDARVRARAKAAARNASPVVVLGAGPAGLLAAHAVALAGGEPVIFSAPGEDGQAVKSPMNGAIYLHEAIPDATTAKPDGMIRFAKVGKREDYALKLYGSRYAPCSWDKFDEGDYPAWALQPVYDDLWNRYSGNIVPITLDRELIQALIADFPSIVSTVPAHVLCEKNEDGTTIHPFERKSIWVTPTASDATRTMAAVAEVDNIIVYDGTNWQQSIAGRYRSSIIFGTESTEFSRWEPELNRYGAVHGMKITRATSCDCCPEIVRAGRWGSWTPGVLVHHAFKKVWDLMFNEYEGVN